MAISVLRLSRDAHRRRIHVRLRTHIAGTEQQPRLCVHRSNKHIRAQVVDDRTGATLASASSLDKEVRQTIKGGGNIAASRVVGKIIAERSRAKGIQRVVFDRGGYRYHGRVQALAEAAREAGLKF